MIDVMNVLWVLAHPEPRSLNGYLATEGQRALRAEGHQVEESDLYAMNWNPTVDTAGYAHRPAERFQVAAAADRAYKNGTQSADIRAEQEKITRADAIVIQFPMWWFGMPAILKGWFDRVWHQGFAYGLRGPNGEWIGYGDGFLAGKRAMAVVTMGGSAWSYGERGIHGAVDDLLFPLQHGTLFYAGAGVLPPVLIPGPTGSHPRKARQRPRNCVSACSRCRRPSRSRTERRTAETTTRIACCGRMSHRA